MKVNLPQPPSHILKESHHGSRHRRLEKRVLQLISDLYFREFHNPDIGFTTFVDCRLSKDYSHAKIFISIYEPYSNKAKEIQAKTFRALKKYIPLIRGRIAKNIRMKKIPSIHFEQDDSLAKAQRMDELLSP